MPPAQDVSSSTLGPNLRHSSTTNSQSLTPPPEHMSFSESIQVQQDMRFSHSAVSGNDDNTAAGMALSQEDSMYITSAASPTVNMSEEIGTHTDGEDQTRTDEDVFKNFCHTTSTYQSSLPDERNISSNTTVGMPMISGPTTPKQSELCRSENNSSSATSSESAPSTPIARSSPRFDSIPRGLAKVDLDFDRNSRTPAWDISDQRPTCKSPSSLFQPYARYIGTQQSDRQTYNVEVTILTVDMNQCSLSGYLLIRGLTPEHPLLQTFFTGEIVGGPNQRYSFKTMDPAWGANDKVDLQHWLRFPAWRHLSSHAKRDMDFEFPLDDQPWYTQDHVFMRWKEHFLVPDYKQSNIQGASFEGFYYICLNQMDGKISGVYFHSKSEKYQQLELTHVNKRGVWAPGVSPLVEFR